MKDVTWRDYVDRRFEESDKAVRAALEATQKEAGKLASELKEYKAQANEWRGAMTDREGKFALNSDTERIEQDVKKLQLWEAKLSGMATQEDVNRAQLIAIVGTLISIGIGIASIIFK